MVKDLAAQKLLYVHPSFSVCQYVCHVKVLLSKRRHVLSNFYIASQRRYSFFFDPNRCYKIPTGTQEFQSKKKCVFRPLSPFISELVRGRLTETPRQPIDRCLSVTNFSSRSTYISSYHTTNNDEILRSDRCGIGSCFYGVIHAPSQEVGPQRSKTFGTAYISAYSHSNRTIYKPSLVRIDARNFELSW